MERFPNGEDLYPPFRAFIHIFASFGNENLGTYCRNKND